MAYQQSGAAYARYYVRYVPFAPGVLRTSGSVLSTLLLYDCFSTYSQMTVQAVVRERTRAHTYRGP